MKITEVVTTPVAIKYRPEYQADKRYYPKPPEQTNVIVEIHTDEGQVGIGEAAHAPGIYGETAGATIAGIDYVTPALLGQDPRQITKINMGIDRLSPVGNIAAKAGLDIALHDLVGKILGVPVYQLLGGRVHESVKTHITPATYEDTASDLLELIDKGYRAFKQKMSGDTEYDLALIESLLDRVPDHVVLSLDVNQGWSVKETLDVISVLERRAKFPRNVILEQPIDGADIRGAARIRNATAIPIMLDDGIRTAADLQRILDAEAADIVSLKISRVGGIQRCLQMIKMAEATNVSYIVDEINEMRVANTAVAHLALASKSPLYTGVACHLLLETDIVTSGGVWIEDGEAHVNDRPGLGIDGLDLSTVALPRAA
ncbi:mandelate racemase/muconate lactonizing enzyme family protein [Nonomuraea sp. K274]|uniref:Mandelate racemase/muconate lactonizing enzyme family protein n=1 Tax=Nonomuraea cypriaca TaxID=1187855 RepID=A0A931AGL5_9ACTN|nr:mandelate racemase/muconate lactonizing enzyme family protein [Nonomuraea cypriaca]MBF8192597.1 mandelate racemase/muconate lactonizing enzyme family protein [Nonomuraea cypriaca]